MIEYFQLTNKGITPISELPSQSFVTASYYGMSLGLEIILLLCFIGLFAFSVYRSVKKIKNPKFRTDNDEEQSEEASQADNMRDGKQTNDNLIYRFDQEDHEKERKIEGEEEQAKADSVDENSEDQYQRQHDENQDRFLEIDASLVFLQPFLIGNIICLNIFACDFISIISLLATIIIYFIFNIKGACANVKILSLIFMLPALLSFLPAFINDTDMTT